MLSNLKNFIKKFKKWIIIAIFGSTALAGGLSGIPQDLYNNLNVKVYSVCDLQSAKRTSIADDLTNFKAKNPDNSLRGLNAGERAGFKSCEISKRGNEFAGSYISAQYGTRIEIIGEVKAIEINGQHGIELFARAWKNGQPLGFGKDGSVEIERFRIFNPPVLVEDLNGTIIREWTEEITGELKQRKLREDLLEATRQVIAHNAKIVGKENAPIVLGKVGNTTSTFYPDANPETNSVDGVVYRTGVSEVWGTIRAGAGNLFNDTAITTELFNFDSTSSSNLWVKIARGIWLFDTSALADTDTIDSATLSFYGQSKVDQGSYSPSVNVYASTPASNTALANSDYGNVGSTAFSTAITYAGFSTAGYNDFILNASGLADVSKTGVSKFSTRSLNDADNVAPTWAAGSGTQMVAYAADQTGTTSDPKLVVVHSGVAVQGEEYQIIFD